MAFTDLISSSFLFSIAIIIILIGAIFAYVSYRMSEQDHKISSMLGLVTTMAEEMQFFRNKLSKIQEQDRPVNNSQSLFDPNNLLHIGAIHANNLISVSDDDRDEEDDDEDENETVSDNVEDEDDDESCSDEDMNESDEDEDENEDEDEDENETVSDEDDKTNLDHLIVEEFDLEQNTQFLNITSINNQSDENNNTKMIHLEEIVDVSENEVHSHNSLDNIFSGDLKTISIFDLEETNKKTNDYKKMSLNKLRDVVIEKGLVSDASKLKKNELVKLLED
jgi:hypothetical protein